MGGKESGGGAAMWEEWEEREVGWLGSREERGERREKDIIIIIK